MQWCLQAFLIFYLNDYIVRHIGNILRTRELIELIGNGAVALPINFIISHNKNPIIYSAITIAVERNR